MPELHKRRICHFTTVHIRYDTRIFVKECQSLVKHGFDTHLIVADGKGDELRNGVQIHDLGKPKNRLKRILFSSGKAFNKAISLKADVYHFHDPELLRVGKKLVKKGKKVIYDSHEDVPRQVLDKAYIPNLFRKPISKLIEWYENRIVSKLSGVVTVTPNLERRFSRSNKNVVQVRNFPKIEEFDIEKDIEIRKKNEVCYVGAITKVRGILNMVEAMKYGESKLLLGGKFETNELRDEAVKSEGWKNVKELGFLSREEVKNALNKSVAGLVVLEPTRSYLESIPVKMFEYMIAGIPVIASDFPYWRELIEKEDCAIFVDPLSPKEISNALQSLTNDKERALEMGKKGRIAVLKKYNWGTQENKLIEFYNQLA